MPPIPSTVCPLSASVSSFLTKQFVIWEAFALPTRPPARIFWPGVSVSNLIPETTQSSIVALSA